MSVILKYYILSILVHSAKCRAANFPAIHYVRGGDIVFISLHSFCPHVHTEHWTPAEMSINIYHNVLSTTSHLTHMDTFTLTSSHPHPHTSYHHTPTLTPHTITPRPSHLPPLHLPSLLYTPLPTLTPSHFPPHPSHLTMHTLLYSLLLLLYIYIAIILIIIVFT